MNKYYVSYFVGDELIQELVEASNKLNAVMLAIWYHCESLNSLDGELIVDDFDFELDNLVQLSNKEVIPSVFKWITEDEDNLRRVQSFIPHTEQLILSGYIERV